VAPPDRLPVDPMIHPPPGYREELRGRPGGFTGEPDVFDTWFTSSLTPQIGSGWVLDPQSHRRLFPMDVRPQAHEIIRTWAFYTIVKAALHEDTVPWAHALISGWILDPDRRKMSKSKGGAVTPMQFLERYSADGVRYWAAGARLGVDTAFDETAFKVGRRLVTKLYNAARFVLAQEAPVRPISREIDRAFVGKLRRLIGQVSPSMEAFDYAGALEQTEAFFWRSFTDTYIELAKNRARAGSPAAGRGSAVAALRLGLQVLVRLFAPVLPYITEEIWSWAFAEGTGRESVHLAPWPDAGELDAVERPSFEESFDLAASALGRIHREKTLAQRSVSAAIEELVLEGSPADLPALRLVQDDLAAAARVARLTLREKPGAERGQIEIGGVLFSPGP
jgi:valyl-tRNA synthetase